MLGQTRKGRYLTATTAQAAAHTLFPFTLLSLPLLLWKVFVSDSHLKEEIQPG